MRKIIISLLLLFSINVFAQEELKNPSLEQIKACGLPVVIINTVNGEEPYSEPIYAPEGENGIGLTNVTKVPGCLIIINGNDTIYNSGEYVEGKSGMTIRHRGNTSAQYNKKPYKIKLQKKADLLCRGDERFKDKEWILLTGYHIGLSIGFMTNELLGIAWTPQLKRVNVFINGDYRGLYSLLESVKRNADCRIDVDKDEGYIFECDPYWWNEEESFKSNSGRHFTFKYPDDNDITEEQISYIQNNINELEQSFADGTYDDVIDVESFARWILGQDFLGTTDAAGTNMYMIKKDHSSKIQMGPLWDFDSEAWAKNDAWSGSHGRYFYYQDIFNNQNRDFVRTYKKIWNNIKDSFYENLKDTVMRFATSAEADATTESMKYEEERWQYSGEDTLITNCKNLFDYYDARMKWLDSAINALNEEDGISTINTDDYKDAERIYSITGQCTKLTRRGIYIKGGRKFVRMGYEL